MSNLAQNPAEWLKAQFEHEWCWDCGRDERHHTALPFAGNWFARCDLAPQFDTAGELIVNPEGYSE